MGCSLQCEVVVIRVIQSAENPYFGSRFLIIICSDCSLIEQTIDRCLDRAHVTEYLLGQMNSINQSYENVYHFLK
jgi:hypothetical protein